jgi:hypothetical protein
MNWRLYYEDGSTFDDMDGKPWDSPRWGMVAVAQPGTTKFKDRLINGPVFLYREDWGCWMETADPEDLLSEYCPVITAYRKGRYMRRDLWKAIMNRVVDDLDS